MECPLCKTNNAPSAKLCGTCGTEFTVRNVISAYGERLRAKLPQTSDGRSALRCVRCDNPVPLRARKCDSCQLEFASFNVVRVMLQKFTLRLGLLPMQPLAARNYSILMAVLFGAALFFMPVWVLGRHSFGAVASGFFHAVLLMTFFVSLFVWVIEKEFVRRMFVESPPAARIGHFCTLAFVFIGLWVVALLVPVPTATLLIVLAGLWAAIFVFLRFVVPFISQIIAYLKDDGQGGSGGFNAGGPQGRDVKED
jgi:hypothetical protein